jgi:hypothetical protein
LIDSEIIWVTEKSGGDFINSVRGAENTTPATHSNGADAYLVYSANLFNQLKRGIIALETFLATPATEKTVASGVLTVDESRHTIQPESGTADDIVTITGIPDNTYIILFATDEGTDTLTFKHGTGNISCSGAADILLSHGFVIGYFDGTKVYLTGGSGGGTAGDMVLADVQTVTGAKTFGSAGAVSKLKIAGTTSGATTLDTSAVAGTAVVTIPAVTDTLVGKATTDTLTNKRWTPRVLPITSSATPTINTDDYDAVTITAQAAAITSMTTNLSGTPTNFQRLLFRIKDNGTAWAITWGASFEAKGVALPTTTVLGKVLTVGFIYNTVTSKWGCVASAQEA